MTKQVNAKNQIWYEQEGGVTRIGFTRDFLNGMSQCWHILPANRERVNEKSPLMVVETNDHLISIVSPVAAAVDHWNDRAQNFPYQLTEEDVVLTLRTGATIRRAEVAVNVNNEINMHPALAQMHPALAQMQRDRMGNAVAGGRAQAIRPRGNGQFVVEPLAAIPGAQWAPAAPPVAPPHDDEAREF